MSTGGRSHRSESVSIEDTLVFLAGADDDLLGTCCDKGESVPATSECRMVDTFALDDLLVDLDTV